MTSLQLAASLSPATFFPASPAGPGLRFDPGTAAGSADAHLQLERWTSPSAAGDLAYADAPGYRVTAGMPRSHPDRLPRLYAEFREDCARAQKSHVGFGLPEAVLERIDPHGKRARWHLGDLPVFGLSRWRTGGPVPIPARIRGQSRRARNAGVRVRHLPEPPRDPEPLLRCLREWMRMKPLPPLRFMTTPFLFDPWPRDGVLVAEHEGRIRGFLTGSSSLFGELWRVDAVGRTPDAPNGTAEFLIREAFRRAEARGFARATLGLAPLARRSRADSTSPWMDRCCALMRRGAAPFYSFTGLENFKAKFEPDAWVPLYCVAPGSRFVPGDFLAVARAFAGGSVLRYGAAAGLRGIGVGR